MTEASPVTREEFRMLANQVRDNAHRLEQIDTGGTRGVAVLAVQMQEVVKDVAALSRDVETHDRRHDEEMRQRVTGRRWMVMAAIGLIAAIDGPVVTVVLARGGR